MSPLRNSDGSKALDLDSEYRLMSFLGIVVSTLSWYIQYLVCSSGMSWNGAFFLKVLIVALAGTK